MKLYRNQNGTWSLWNENNVFLGTFPTKQAAVNFYHA